MNAPLRFETLLWMASPIMAWAQASAEPPPALVAPKPARASRGAATRLPRKRGKSGA